MRFLLPLLLVFGVSPALGQTTLWTGGIDDVWEEAGNWNNGLPVSGGTATIDGINTGVFYDSDSFPAVGPLGTLNLTGGAFLQVGTETGPTNAVLRVNSILFEESELDVMDQGELVVTGGASGSGYLYLWGNASFDQLDLTDGVLEVFAPGSATVSGAASFTNSSVQIFGQTDFLSDLSVGSSSIASAFFFVDEGHAVTVGGDLSLDGAGDTAWMELSGQVAVTGGTMLTGDSVLWLLESTADFSTAGYDQNGGIFYGDAGTFLATGPASITDGEFYVGWDSIGISADVQFDNSLLLDGPDGLVDIQIGKLTVNGLFTQDNGSTLLVQDEFVANGGIELNGAANLSVLNLGVVQAASFHQLDGDTQVLDGSFDGGVGTVQGGSFTVGDAGVSAGTATFSSLAISGASTVVSTVDQGSGGDQSLLTITGATSLADGELRIGQGSQVQAQGGLTISSGKLTGYDELVGDLTQNGGVIAPGVDLGLADGGDFGSLLLTGDYTINAGFIELQIGGVAASGEYDAITVNGNVTVEGGQAVVSVINGFDPLSQPGATWDVLTVNGSFSGGGSAIDNFLGSLSGTGLRWDVSDFDLVGGTGGTIRLVAVPEPATYGVGGLLIVGMMIVGWRRRRRRLQQDVSG